MAKKTAAKPDAPPPLPRELLTALPTAIEVVKLLYQVEALRPRIEKELKEAMGEGSVALARAFVVQHRMMAVLKDRIKPFEELFELYKTKHVPAKFEDDGVTHHSLAAGFRVTTSYATRAAMIPDKKEEAKQWLRENHPDVVIETVNASTLSALAKQLAEEQNLDLPRDLFNTTMLPGTSVTRT